MSGGSKPSGSQTVVNQTSNSPWGPQQDYLTAGFEAAKKNFESDKPQYFPGSTVTPFSAETQQAINMKTASANDPNSLIGKAGTEADKTLSGAYLDASNPVFRNMLEGVTGLVKPQVSTQFAGAGRGTSSPGYAEALGRGITAGMLPYISSERDRMGQAVAAAPTVGNYAADQLATVGATNESKSKENLQDQINRYDFGQNVDSQKLAQYMAAISGGYGGTGVSQTTQPTYSNPLMSGLGAASSVAGIGSSLFAPAGGGGMLSGSK